MKSHPKLKLPSLVVFKRLSIRARTVWFAKWAKTKRGSYDYCDVQGCALYHFGCAITSKTSSAGSQSFSTPEQVMVTTGWEAHNEPHTYVALSKRLTAHLAAS